MAYRRRDSVSGATVWIKLLNYTELRIPKSPKRFLKSKVVWWSTTINFICVCCMKVSVSTMPPQWHHNDSHWNKIQLSRWRHHDVTLSTRRSAACCETRVKTSRSRWIRLTRSTSPVDRSPTNTPSRNSSCTLAWSPTIGSVRGLRGKWRVRNTSSMDSASRQRWATCSVSRVKDLFVSIWMLCWYLWLWSWAECIPLYRDTHSMLNNFFRGVLVEIVNLRDARGVNFPPLGFSL